MIQEPRGPRGNRRVTSETHPTGWVLNLSSKELDEAQTRVLEKGLAFAPTPKLIPAKGIVAEVEAVLRKVLQQAADEV